MATNQRDVSVGITAQTSGLGAGLNQAVSQLNAAISQMNTSMQSLTSTSQSMQQSVAGSLRTMQAQMQQMAANHTASSAQISAGLNQIAANTARPARAAPVVASAWSQAMASMRANTVQTMGTLHNFGTQVTARMVGAVSTIGLAIVGLKSAYKAAAEFQDLESRVRSLLVTASDAPKVLAMIRNVSRDLPATFTEVGDAWYLMSSQGINANEDLLRSVVALNATSSQSMKHTIQMVGDFMQKDSKRMRQYGIDVQYVGNEANVAYKGKFFPGVKLTSTAVAELVKNLANIDGGGADAAKEKMDDLKTATNRLKEDWDAFLVKLQTGPEGEVGGGLKSVITGIDKAILFMTDHILEMNIAVEYVKQGFLVFSGVIGVVASAGIGAAELIFHGFQALGNLLLGVAMGVGLAFAKLFSNIGSNIKAIMSGDFGAIKGAFDGVGTAFTTEWNRGLKSAGTSVKGFTEGWGKQLYDATIEGVGEGLSDSRGKVAAYEALQKRKELGLLDPKPGNAPTKVGEVTTPDKPKKAGSGRTASTVAAELGLIKAQMEAELGILRAKNKLEEQIVQEKYDNFMISYEKFARDKEAMQVAEIEREIELRRMAVDEINKKVSSGQEKDKIKAATEIVKINGQIKEDEIRILQIKQKTTAEIQKQQREMEKLMVSLRSEFADLTGSFDPSAKIAEMRKGMEENLKKMRAEGNTEGASLIEKMMDVKEAKTRIDFIDREMSVFNTKRETEMLKIDGLVAQGKLSFTDAETMKMKALEDTNKEMLRFIDLQIEQARLAGDPAVIASLEKRRQEIQNQVGQMDELTKSVKQSIESNLGTALSDMMNGTKSVSEAFKDMFKSILQEFNNMIAKQLAKDLMGQLMPQSGGGILNSIFGMLGGGGGGGAPAAGGSSSGSWISSLMSVAGSFFGGFRENGGSVSAGQAYIVGEKRPEVFVPNTSGTIIPQVGGGSSTNVFHISTPDANSFRRSEAQISNQYANAMNRSLRRNS